MRTLTFFLTLFFTFVTTTASNAQAPNQPLENQTTVVTQPDSPATNDVDQKEYAQILMNLYTNLCVANMGNMMAIREQIRDQQPIPQEITPIFLNDIPGKVWSVSSPKGAFMFALADDIYYCSVYALELDIEQINTLFHELVSTNPPNGSFSQLKDESSIQPDGQSIHTQTYILSFNEQSVVALLTLRTSTQPTRGYPQASLSLKIDSI